MIEFKNGVFGLHGEGFSCLIKVNDYGLPELLHFGEPVLTEDADAFICRPGLGWGESVLLNDADTGSCPDSMPLEWSGSGVQEPMSYQTESGRIRTFSRTDLGCQYECYSDDDGITWTDPMPNRNFTSPCSPMMMKRVGKYTVALLNPIPRYPTAVYDVVDDRSPLIFMLSEDDGKTFPFYQVLDNRGHVCYPDLFDGGNYFLVGYQQLDDGMIKKVYLDDAEIS